MIVLLYCETGSAIIEINYRKYNIVPGTTVTLAFMDIVSRLYVSNNFSGYLHGVARENRSFKSYVVDASVKGLFTFYFVAKKKPARLSHNFAKNHTWHYRVVWEVTFKEKFLVCYTIFGIANVVALASFECSDSSEPFTAVTV